MATDLRYDFEINGITGAITDLKGLAEALKLNNKALKEAVLGSKEYTQALMQNNGLKVFQKEILATSQAIVRANQNVTNSLGGSQTASANASMALLNLNYVVRDSPYFFQNFALGVLAVGNNLNPLIDSFNRLRKEALEKNLTTVGLLRQALVGGAGISIAFSLVVTAIQAFVFWQAKSKKSVDETTESIKKQMDALNEMSRTELVKAQIQAGFELSNIDVEAKRKRDEYMRGATQTGLGGKTAEPPPLSQFYTEEQKKQIVNLNTIIKQSEWLLNNRGLLKGIEAEITKLRKDQAATRDPNEIKRLEQEIKGLEKYKDELRGIVKEAEKLKRLRPAQAFEPTSGGGVGGIARRGFFAGSETNKRFGMKQSENTKAFGLNQPIKDIGIGLEMGKIAAQELGNAISSAFESGTIKIKEFLSSLGLAIAKMLLLKAITSLLTGGGSAVANVATASIGGKEGMWSTGWGDATRFNKSSNPTFVFENTIEGQKIIYKGVKERNAILR